MLALSFTFPAGRYHATPWDRHVNEGVVAWPPEPWRLLRAFIATWHHKVKPAGKHTELTLLGLIESLAQELPQYSLPAVSHSHTRHYMPQFNIGKTSLIFDAFTAIDESDPLIVIWPTLDLPDEQATLLDDLLAVMGYLGRAESWVEAQRIDVAPEPNCKPGTEMLDTDTGEIRGESITLFASRAANEYKILRDQFLADNKTLRSTLPENLLEALSLDTTDLRKQGWNQPPAARKVNYLRPVNSLRPVRVMRKASVPAATTARFIITGKPLPRIVDSVRIGEWLRMGLMGKAKRMLGENNVPQILSGHDMPNGNKHEHAFYLPEDADGHGHIDHVTVYAKSGFGKDAYRVLNSFTRLWNREGQEWRLILEDIGPRERMRAYTPLLGESETWISVTPYLHPWFAKKNLTVEDQIKKECRMRGLPEPVVLERLEFITINGRERTPIHFHRFRSKRGLTQPDTHGGFWKLTFPKPISGPLALGFGCHYGLGMFKPFS